MATLFFGVVIAESLEDRAVLQRLNITSTKVETVTPKHQTPWVRQWTLHTVEISEADAPAIASQISQSLDSRHPWYADFKSATHHYIIFRGKVFLVERTSKEQYDAARRYGISLGIPEYQVDFHPDMQDWQREQQ
jgi:hypothetical protein